MKPRRRKWIALILLVGLCGGLGYVFTHGGLVTVLRLPPVRDSSTPAAQNGYLLLSVRREPDTVHFRDPASPAGEYERKGGYALQVQAPLLAPTVTTGAVTPVGAYAVTARASTGDVFPLFWHTVPSSGRPRLSITIPPAYPPAYHYLDVAVVSPSGASAHWRFTRLQWMRHTLSTPIITHDTIQAAGLTFRGRAYWVRLQGSNVPVQIMGYVGITGRPNTGLHYDIGMGGGEPEWMPYAASPLPILPPNPNVYWWSEAISDANNPGGGPGINFDASDAPFDQFVTTRMVLTEYDRYDEQVTFHNVDIAPSGVLGDKTSFLVVSQTQTQKTASGLTVTLPAQSGKMEDYRNNLIGSAVNMKLSISPDGESLALPGSPLYQKYHKPVQVLVNFQAPIHLGGWSLPGKSTERAVAFYWPKSFPSHLNTLMLIVR